MNVALPKVLTVPDYLAWAETRVNGSRTELINGQIVAMSPELSRTIARRGRFLHAPARGREAGIMRGFHRRPDGADRRYTAYEPDANGPARRTAACEADENLRSDHRRRGSLAKLVHMDTSAKLIGDFKLVSVTHYLVIDPDERAVTHHKRGADGNVASETLSSGPLRLDPPGISVEIAELMGRVGFSAPVACHRGTRHRPRRHRLALEIELQQRVDHPGVEPHGDFGAPESAPRCGASIPCCGNRARAPSTDR